jgi:hypothetical protein
MKRFYILSCVALLFFCCESREKAYEEKVSAIQNAIGISNYNVLIDYFKDTDKRFPASLSEVYMAYKHTWPDDIKQIELRHFVDIFSRQGEWVGYFPIYDSKDSLIVSYLLLSAGVDGKLDNVTDSLSKLHINDWKQKLVLYNPDEYDGMVFKDSLHSNEAYAIKGDLEKIPPYNAKDEKNGSKDLLIHVHHLVVPIIK